MGPINDDIDPFERPASVDDLDQPGRRVFSVYDGAGQGDGKPCGQLVPVPSV